MKTRYRTLALLAMLASAAPLTAQEKAPAANPLASLERFAGEWVVDGKWSDGQSLHARAVYAWGLGKKIMKASTFVQNGATEYQRYEGILAWDPEKKRLFQISFSFDGSISKYVIECKDRDTLHIGWVPYADGKAPKVRQVLRFVDNDHFQWIVALRDGDGWKQIIDATWRRKK